MEPHVHRFELTDWDGPEAEGAVAVATVVCECGQTRPIRTIMARAAFEEQLAQFNVEGEPASEDEPAHA